VGNIRTRLALSGGLLCCVPCAETKKKKETPRPEKRRVRVVAEALEEDETMLRTTVGNLALQCLLCVAWHGLQNPFHSHSPRRRYPAWTKGAVNGEFFRSTRDPCKSPV